METTVFDRAFEVAADLERQGLPQGIHAVTVGYKRKGGVTTTQPALVFLVEHKRDPKDIHPSMLVPPEISGFVTDVVEMKVVPHDDHPGPYDKVEPLVGGVRIKADWKHGIGTLGAVFCNRTTRQPMGVTNRHVVDNWTFNANGQTVFQPSESAQNRIGTVWQHDKAWDCAAVAIDVGSREVDRLRSFLGCPGRIVAMGRALVGMPVFKVGARTGRTQGVVASTGPSLVEIRNREGEVGTELSDHGDSGSIWAFETPDGYMAVALHWGGSTGLASGKPMPEVARLLELDVEGR